MSRDHNGGVMQRSGLKLLWLVVFGVLLSALPVVAMARSAPPADVFVAQENPDSTDGTCTLASSVMVLRNFVYRYVTRYGGACPSDLYIPITESQLMNQTEPTAIWQSGLLPDFTFRNDKCSLRMIREYPGKEEDITEFLCEKLQQYPEGIVLYGTLNATNRHAVFLYDFDSENDAFLCGDPYSGTSDMALMDCIFFKQFESQDVALSHVNSIWYIDHDNAVVAYPPPGFASYSDTKDLGNRKTTEQYRGSVAYLGSFDDLISRVDLGGSDRENDQLGIVLYDESFAYDESFTGEYLAFQGEGTYFLDQYADGTGTSFDNAASSAIVFTSSEPPFQGIRFNAVTQAQNLVVHPVYAAEMKPTPTPAENPLAAPYTAAIEDLTPATAHPNNLTFPEGGPFYASISDPVFDYVKYLFTLNAAQMMAEIPGSKLQQGSVDCQLNNIYIYYDNEDGTPLYIAYMNDGTVVGNVHVGMTISDIEQAWGVQFRMASYADSQYWGAIIDGVEVDFLSQDKYEPVDAIIFSLAYGDETSPYHFTYDGSALVKQQYSEYIAREKDLLRQFDMNKVEPFRHYNENRFEATGSPDDMDALTLYDKLLHMTKQDAVEYLSCYWEGGTFGSEGYDYYYYESLDEGIILQLGEPIVNEGVRNGVVWSDEQRSRVREIYLQNRPDFIPGYEGMTFDNICDALGSPIILDRIWYSSSIVPNSDDDGYYAIFQNGDLRLLFQFDWEIETADLMCVYLSDGVGTIAAPQTSSATQYYDSPELFKRLLNQKMADAIQDLETQYPGGKITVEDESCDPNDAAKAMYYDCPALDLRLLRLPTWDEMRYIDDEYQATIDFEKVWAVILGQQVDLEGAHIGLTYVDVYQQFGKPDSADKATYDMLTGRPCFKLSYLNNDLWTTFLIDTETLTTFAVHVTLDYGFQP